MDTEKQFYIFIDAENINQAIVAPVFNEIIKYGTISGKRAYADWSNPIYKIGQNSWISMVLGHINNSIMIKTKLIKQ
jgi:hypothetical protein